MQLAGNGADGPFLGVVVAQDLHLDVRRRHHRVRRQQSIRRRWG
jgi:hypothetical protein